ncbi:hypothetical protein LEP1GSC170_2502 [Leptospira interrogans serovar Bataviae str. HAI135]|nr:hypothetical protein LEP1GSC170_2502 [Leptospira interrogans serovar Bataviae str. HAI135]
MDLIKNTVFKTTSKRTNHGLILIVGFLILFLLDFFFLSGFDLESSERISLEFQSLL